MRESNAVPFFTFLSNLFKEFITETTYPYKLIEIRKCENEKIFLAKLQLSAKNLFFEKPVQDVVADTLLVQSLSPLHVRTITYYACLENSLPEFKIDSWIHSEDENENALKIKNCKTGLSDIKTPAEISKESNLIKKFSAKDAHTIGYMFGIYSIVHEKIKIKE